MAKSGSPEDRHSADRYYYRRYRPHYYEYPFGKGESPRIEEEIYLNTLIAEAQLQMTIGYIAFGMCVMLGITLWIYRR